MLLSEVQSFGQARNKVECAHVQKYLKFAAKNTDTDSHNLVNCLLEPKLMRRMDSTEKRNGIVTNENDRVTEEVQIDL